MKSFNEIKVNESGITELCGNSWQCKYWGSATCRALVLHRDVYVLEVRQSSKGYISSVKLNSWQLNRNLATFEGSLIDVIEKALTFEPAIKIVGAVKWYQLTEDEQHLSYGAIDARGAAELTFFKGSNIPGIGHFAATLYLSSKQPEITIQCSNIFEGTFTHLNFELASQSCLTLDDFVQKKDAVLIA